MPFSWRKSPDDDDYFIDVNTIVGVEAAGGTHGRRRSWFLTRAGGPLAPSNVLRRHVFSACKRLGLPAQRADVPAHVLVLVASTGRTGQGDGAQLMGHANVDTTINVYTQVLDGSVLDAVERVGSQMNAIERNPGSAAGATTATARTA
jgi:integrase